MTITIEIPKEFENHFKTDKFQDSLARVISDLKYRDYNVCSLYELETIEMLKEAFNNVKGGYIND